METDAVFGGGSALKSRFGGLIIAETFPDVAKDSNYNNTTVEGNKDE